MYYKDRVILLKGDSSNWYEQAIFIVKNNIPMGYKTVDLVAEAEKIISGFDGYHGTNVLIQKTERNHISKYPSIDYKTENPAGLGSILNALEIVFCIVASWFLLGYFI